MTDLGGTRTPLVLVVEDAEDTFELLADVLAGSHYEVVGAENGIDAVDTAVKLLPDLILMDLQLPGIDGLELTRRLKADAKTADIKIIAVTAYAMKGDQEKAFEAGCDGYVTKPIDTRALPALIAAQVGAAS